MDDVEKLAKVLVQKLDVDELLILCDLFEDGRVNRLFVDYLFPQDKKNHPEKYV